MADFTLGALTPVAERVPAFNPTVQEGQFAQIHQVRAQTAGLNQQQDIIAQKQADDQKAQEIAMEQTPGGGAVGELPELYKSQLVQAGLTDHADAIQKVIDENRWKSRHADYETQIAKTKDDAQLLAEAKRKTTVVSGALAPAQNFFSAEWKNPELLDDPKNPNREQFLKFYDALYPTLAAEGFENNSLTPAQAAANPSAAMRMLPILASQSSTYAERADEHDKTIKNRIESIKTWGYDKDGTPSQAPQAPLPTTMTPEQLADVQAQAGAKYPTMGNLPAEAVAANKPSPEQAFAGGYTVPGLSKPAPAPEQQITVTMPDGKIATIPVAQNITLDKLKAIMQYEKPTAPRAGDTITAKDDEKTAMTLADHINSLRQSSRSALGTAGKVNMNADRALMLTRKGANATPEDKHMAVQDMLTLMKGGTPDEAEERRGMYGSLREDAIQKLEYYSGNPTAMNNPAGMKKLEELFLELKEVDNKIIEDNMGVYAASAKGFISRNPEQWAKMTGAVMRSTVPPKLKSEAELKTYTPEEAKNLTPGTRFLGTNGKTYTR